MEGQSPQVFDAQQSLLQLEGRSDEEVEELGRKLYSELFLTTATRGVYGLHDGQEVVFYKDTFDHAFYKTPGKHTIDSRRVARIHWINPLLRGRIVNSECWLVNDNGINKRIYLCFNSGYIIWLKERLDGRWAFLTAYNTPAHRLREYIRGGIKVSKF